MTTASFSDVAAMIAALRPERPVYCVRPHVVEATARRFVETFPGDVLYAVKCNSEPLFLDALHAGGVRHFDTASIAEVELVAGRFADAHCYFMHPVKARGAVRRAYGEFGVRHFVVDHADELAKLDQELSDAPDLVTVVRLATAKGGAVYDLGGKFGATVEDAAAILRRARDLGHRLGLSFHVGSQCLRPESYRAALRLSRAALDAAQVQVELIDVGGGFPIAYVGVEPPPLSAYVAEIRAGFAELPVPPGCRLLAEPGRALVGAGASLVVRAELRKGQALYVNDGVFGSLSDLNMPGIEFPMRVWRGDSPVEGGQSEFTLYGPTCDSADVMKGPFWLPDDVREGDWIEIGQMGAYTTALRTGFNGFYPNQFAVVADDAFLPTKDMRPRAAA